MKKNLLVGCLVLTILLTGCGAKKETENPNGQETTENDTVILEDQKINDLDFTYFNIFTDSDNVTQIYFEIENNTENVLSFNNLTVNLYEKNELVLSIPALENQMIESSSSIVVKQNTDLNLYNVDRVEYIVE